MLWNAYDNVKLAILLATFACWWLSYADETNETSVAHPSSERKYWKSSDPTLVAEGLLAVVTVMSYLRLLFLCQLNYSLGPMQVSLGKMTTDFARVAILFAIVILAFMAGLCNFYQYYGGMTRTDSVTGYEVSQDESFTSLRATLKTLFWSVFCMTSANAGSVVIEAPASVTDDGVAEDVANNHYFTQVRKRRCFSFPARRRADVLISLLRRKNSKSVTKRFDMYKVLAAKSNARQAT